MANIEKDNSVFDLESGVPSLPDVPEKTPEIKGELRPKPKFSDRISKRVIGVGIGFIASMLTIFFVSLDAMDKKPVQTPELAMTGKPSEKSESEMVPKDVLSADGSRDEVRSGTLVKPEKPKVIPGTENQGSMFPDQTDVRVPSINDRSGQIPKDGRADKNRIPTAQEQDNEILRQSEALARQQRQTRMEQARTEGMSAAAFSTGDTNAAPEGSGGRGYDAGNTGAIRTAANGSAGYAGAAQQSEQDEKLGFIKDSAKDERSYHPYQTVKPVSKNEIKTGSFIPLALGQGINSDMPGQITARVTEAVYDTITGCRLLIPAMSTVVGKYDSKVALGQNRMLVVWNSLIFPNGDELNLAGMQGYDTSGFAGLDSEVDNHFWRLFGLTFGMSMVTASVQLAVPQTNNSGTTVQSPGQLLQTALAQQYGQLGGQILGKYMAVQPTLKNYPGERFLIAVPRTIVLEKVWRNRCESRL